MVRELNVRQMLEWYDGMVVALVVPTWSDETFLASLLSWSQKRHQRTYALLPLSSEQLRDVEASVTEGWGSLRDQLAMLRHAVNGAISLVVVDDATNQVVSISEAPAEHFRHEFFKDVEQALEAGRHS